MIRVQYQSEEDKQSLIASSVATGKVLVEEANLTEGNFLTFCNVEEIPEPVVPVPTLEERLTELESKVIKLEKDVALKA